MHTGSGDNPALSGATKSFVPAATRSFDVGAAASVPLSCQLTKTTTCTVRQSGAKKTAATGCGSTRKVVGAAKVDIHVLSPEDAFQLVHTVHLEAFDGLDEER
jgi:hypothetical protein